MMKAIAFVAILAASAYAQDQQQDPVERQLDRLKRDLNLTEEQIPKVKEILKKQSDELHTVLTDEQKQRLDRGNTRGGGQGGQGGGRGGFGGGGQLPSTDELKKQLTLTDDQEKKVDEIRDGVRQQIRELWQNRGDGGNRDEMTKKMETMRDEAYAKMKECLTDEQKPKFDEIVKASQGDGPRNGGGTPTEGGRRGPSVEERVKRVMESLKVEKAEDAAALKDLVQKVIEAQQALGDYDRDTRTKFDDLAKKTEATEDDIKTQLETVRTTRKEKDKTVKDAQKSLAEVVTYRQELECVRAGILR